MPSASMLSDHRVLPLAADGDASSEVLQASTRSRLWGQPADVHAACARRALALLACTAFAEDAPADTPTGSLLIPGNEKDYSNMLTALMETQHSVLQKVHGVDSPQVALSTSLVSLQTSVRLAFPLWPPARHCSTFTLHICPLYAHVASLLGARQQPPHRVPACAAPVHTISCSRRLVHCACAWTVQERSWSLGAGRARGLLIVLTRRAPPGMRAGQQFHRQSDQRVLHLPPIHPDRAILLHRAAG